MTMRRPTLLSLVFLLLALPVTADVVVTTPHTSAQRLYRSVVLVFPFQNHTSVERASRIATSALIAALRDSGLVTVVRPEYEWRRRGSAHVPGVTLDDVRKGEDGRWSTDKVDVYGIPLPVLEKTLARLPRSDLIVHGVVSEIEGRWQAAAVLRNRHDRRLLAAANAKSDEKAGVYPAAAAVSGDLLGAIAVPVLERRSLDVYRLFRQGLIPRGAAAQRVASFLEQYPDVFGPKMVLLLLAREGDDAAESRAAAEAVAEQLKGGEPDLLRLAVQHGADPFAPLVDDARRRGDGKALVALLAEAADIWPRQRPERLRELAKLLERANDTNGALKAYLRIVALSPHDAAAHLRAARLLDGKGAVEQALAHYRAYLRSDPRGEAAATVRARVRQLAGD